MKVLMLSADKRLLEDDSPVRKRMVEYGNLIEQLNIIVFTLRSGGILSEHTILGKTVLYSTASKNKLFYIVDALKIAKKIIFSKKDWLITAQDPFEIGLAAWLISRKFRVPFELQIHTDFLNFYFKKEFFLNRIRVLLAGFLLPKAMGIRVVSVRIKKSLKKYKLRSEPVVLPIFIEKEKFALFCGNDFLKKKYPQFDFLILIASRLSKEKNISLAIGAIQDVINKYPRTGLLIVGSGKEEKKLKLEVKKNDLSKNVIFEPWVNNLALYYGGADLFLLVSNYEGFGMSVVESAATGCPIVMTNVGCAGEIIKNNESGLVVSVGDREALVVAIEKMISDECFAVFLAAGAIKSVLNLPNKSEFLILLKKNWERYV